MIKETYKTLYTIYKEIKTVNKKKKTIDFKYIVDKMLDITNITKNDITDFLLIHDILSDNIYKYIKIHPCE